MRTLRHLLAAAVVSALGVALVAGTPSMAQSQKDLDSTKADPQHHKVVFENEQVRVVRYTLAPGEKTPKHSHPDSVNIYFTDAHAKVTTDDGKVTDFQGKAKSVAWRPAVTHTFENVGDKPIEGILVEPKAPNSSRPAGTADETTLPNPTAKVEFENDKVRVVRYRFQPGQKIGMHGHPDNVQIVLTDAKANIITPDNKTTANEAKAGEVHWRPAIQHSVQNTGDKPFEGILVEMKGTTAAASR